MSDVAHPHVTIIGVAGASGSGKSFFAEKLARSFPARHVTILSQDYYYRDRSEVPVQQRQGFNYDHPDAIEFDLLIENLVGLRAYQPVTHPVYNFSVHNRRNTRQTVYPAPIVIVDGILIFAVRELVNLFDIKVFIDTPLDICFIRRLQRDVRERGRSVESVIQQYTTTVRPMFLQHVLPTKHVSDVMYTGEGDMAANVREIVNHIKKLEHEVNV